MQFYLNLLANIIIQKYFQDAGCLIILSENNNFDYADNLPYVNVQIRNNTFDSNIIFNYFGCQGIVINAKKPVTIFDSFEHEIRHHMDRFNKRQYLFLQVLDESSDDVMDIFNSTKLEFVADLLAISTSSILNDTENFWLNENYEFNLYTHKFVGFNDTNDPVLMDRWYSSNESFELENDLFPNKLKDGHGRLFKVATFSYKPYSVPAVMQGTELSIAYEFTKKYNLNIDLIVDEDGEWGEIYDNWTGYGILGNVLDDNGDVGLAALYTWAHEYGFLDLSKPAVRTGITCLVPKPYLAGGWLVPLFSFTYDMWVGVAIAFIFCCVFLFIMDYFQELLKIYKQLRRDKKKRSRLNNLQRAVLHTTGIFLLQSIWDRRAINDGLKRYVYGSTFIFSLLLASSYSSGLASSMTVPRYIGAIKTVDDLIASGIQWGATSIAWIMSIMYSPEYRYRVLVERFVKTNQNKLKKYNNKRFAFSIERLPAGYYAIGDYITEEGASALRLMNEDIYFEYCVLMTKKSSIWLPAIDDFILLLAQTGIPGVWEYKVATTYLNANIQRAVKYSTTHSESSTQPIELKWSHVQGAFAILAIGLVSSIICFIVEIFKSRKLKMPNKIKLRKTKKKANGNK